MRLTSISALLPAAFFFLQSYSQALCIPQNTNYTRMAGARVGVSEIKIHSAAAGSGIATVWFLTNGVSGFVHHLCDFFSLVGVLTGQNENFFYQPLS